MSFKIMYTPSFSTAVFALLVVYCAYYVYDLDFSVPDEFRFRTGDFINKYGFAHEEHMVESEDGFLTTIFRIIPKQQRHTVPVLIEGGLFCSSDVLVLTGPDKDLAFLLAVEGFDVWLGNFRGNRYSWPGPRANFSDANLHNYGYHEMGFYDFAATIDHILSTTQKPQLDVVGVSAGCSGVLALLSTRPEYNARVRKALHLGCGITLKTSNFYQKIAFYGMWAIPDVIRDSKYYEPYPARPAAMLIICHRTFLRGFCEHWLTVMGFPSPHNATLGALVMTYLPSGSPMGLIAHLMQLSTSGEEAFRMRDWGLEENKRRYSSSSPPIYDVSQITVSTRSYTAQDDSLCTYEIPTSIFGQLSNYAGDMLVPFQHANFFINSAKSPEFIHDVFNTLAEN